jgi:hypothetical protein
MAPVVWESLLFLCSRYVSLITCWSAGGDAEGASRAERCHPHYAGGY